MKVLILIFCLFFCKETKYFSAITADTLDQGPNLIELKEDLFWLNTKEKIKLENLKGKIILLAFIRFTNINSIQVLKNLNELQKKYPKELVVLGIHSPKFSNEKEIEYLRQEVISKNIEFAIGNDLNLATWSSYEMNSWPSFVLISSKGKITGKISGEKVFPSIEESILNQKKYFQIDEKKEFKLELEKDKLPDRLLSFPSKIVLNPKGNEIYISDTNHHRILRIDIDTREILDVVGGISGFEDGVFSEVKFNSPTGIFLKDNYLFVADTFNHSIRRIDFNSKKVITILGSGKPANGFVTEGKGREVSLISPTDITVVKDKLYFTENSVHQIWVLDLNTSEVEKFSGSGRENSQDGKHGEVTYSMPYGISNDNLKLYVSESNSSSIRQLDIEKNGSVKTLVGSGIIEFGDVDGKLENSKIQYPNFLFYQNFKIYFADSLNHKLKVYDLNSKELSTLAGTGKAGNINSDLANSDFFYPSSIFVHKNLAYITDKMNHQIKILDLNKFKVSNFDFKLSEKLFLTNKTKSENFGEIISVQEIELNPSSTEINLKFEIEKGFSFLENAPYYFYSYSKDQNSIKILNQNSPIYKKFNSNRIINLKATLGQSEIFVNQILFYKELKKDSEVLIKKFTLKIPLKISSIGLKNPHLSIKVKGVE